MNQASPDSNCPSCGKQTPGKFCTHCGTPLAKSNCSQCQTELPTGARFCHACGAASGGSAGGEGDKKGTIPLPWAVATVLIVVLILVIAVRYSSPSQAASSDPAPQGSAPSGAPDISALSPRQQADRLFDLIMTAAEAGDTGRVSFHTDMAIQAYQMIGDLDGDARYHMGLIHVVRGETSEALAQADSLEIVVPGHLLACVLRGSAARAIGDAGALPDIYRDFLTAYEREIAAERPEYEMHRNSIDSFLNEARTAGVTGN